MTETGIVALVGVAATLLSGLGAAWLTNRSTRQRDLDHRASLVQAEIRALIVEILMAARKWGGAIGGIGGALAFSTSRQDFQRAFPRYLSEPGSDFQQAGDRLQQGLTDAKLRIEEGPLADVIEAMSNVMLRWWDDVLEEMSRDLDGEHPLVDRRLELSATYVKQWSDLVRTLEETARFELPRIDTPVNSRRERVH